MRDSVHLLLSTTGNMKVVASHESCHDLIEKLHAGRPDVILMDIDMPGTNGIDAVKLLRRHFPDLPVLMLTGFEDDEKVFSSLCAGANGYILKNTRMEPLIMQIEEVYNGGAPMTPVIARRVLNQFAKVHPTQTNNEDFNLSPREKEVLQHLVKGRSYKMIADELHISYDTVHSHIRKIYNKLQVNSAGEAVSKIMENNILRPNS